MSRHAHPTRRPRRLLAAGLAAATLLILGPTVYGVAMAGSRIDGPAATAGHDTSTDDTSPSDGHVAATGDPPMAHGPHGDTLPTPAAGHDVAPADEPNQAPAEAKQGAQPNPNCTLQVPAAPLSAAGLSTPYRLAATDDGAGACHESDANQSAFVEATILDPATGALSVYRPLVVDDGTRPIAAPSIARLPAGAVVGVWFGFNGDTLTLDGPGRSSCVNGTDGSPFGQFAECGAQAFFTAAQAAVGAGRTAIPAPGTADDGLPCPTVRDFGVVDQDQSDNLATTYRTLPDGRTGQDTPAVRPGTKQLTNASDNGLLATAIDPALGCRPFTAPDLTSPGSRVPSLALNELAAGAGQVAPVALIPTNDPMAQVDGKTSRGKTALYRAGVGQPPLSTDPGDPAAYCRNLVAVAPGRLMLDRQRFTAAASPDPAAGTNLYTFLAQRLAASYTELGCGDLITTPNPVRVRTNGDGVATDATISTRG